MLDVAVASSCASVAEVQKLAFKVVRPANVTVTLTTPGGTVAFQEAGERLPGT